jgi:hypothetical protein
LNTVTQSGKVLSRERFTDVFIKQNGSWMALSAHIFPLRALIRPDKQAEPLNHAVVASPARQCAAHIFGKTAGLRRAQEAQASRLDMGFSPHDPVESVTARPVPSC